MTNEIKMLRLYGGEYVIGETNPVRGCPDMINLLNPRLFVFGPGPDGRIRAGFQPVCVFDRGCDAETSVRKSQVWLEIGEGGIPKEILDGYRSDVSGIGIASAADIAAVNGRDLTGFGA